MDTLKKVFLYLLFNIVLSVFGLPVLYALAALINSIKRKFKTLLSQKSWPQWMLFICGKLLWWTVIILKNVLYIYIYILKIILTPRKRDLTNRQSQTEEITAIQSNASEIAPPILNSQLCNGMLEEEERENTYLLDQWEVAGKLYGMQIRTLDQDQQIIAHKLITDILFHAKIKQLTISSSIKLHNSEPQGQIGDGIIFQGKKGTAARGMDMDPLLHLVTDNFPSTLT
uniref:Uncharacterized protein n=2 Tax=Clastoptera arizonana TaxID=38151 RepID=A0A1B6CH94_9HEMI